MIEAIGHKAKRPIIRRLIRTAVIVLLVGASCWIGNEIFALGRCVGEAQRAAHVPSTWVPFVRPRPLIPAETPLAWRNFGNQVDQVLVDIS